MGRPHQILAKRGAVYVFSNRTNKFHTGRSLERTIVVAPSTGGLPESLDTKHVRCMSFGTACRNASALRLFAISEDYLIQVGDALL